MKNGSVNAIIKDVICDDVPNLGAIITLDNKGRLINSQFSKPSSSQTLLKLNSAEEVPDADDLPYSLISYGETTNITNLPYNDHNYVTFFNAKQPENYDRKALDYVSKQSSQTMNRINFGNNSGVRISHFSSYKSGAPHNDGVFYADRYKPQQQFTFNAQLSHSSTPLVAHKLMSNNSHTGFVKNNIVPGAIVLNSGALNKLKPMSVIQLHRPVSTGDTRIISRPITKPTPITNIIVNNSINGNTHSTIDVNSNLTKSVNLTPRCICGYTHDDGGMIRCEICQTWQHIVCMYPDNKFPIYYKCERCESRDVDHKRAIQIQTNALIKSGYNPSDYVVHQPNNIYINDHENKNNNVKTDIKQVANYRSASESLSNTFTIIKKESQVIPSGSPRTSKRKQDLISLKTVIAKPKNIVEYQQPLLIEDNYNCQAASNQADDNELLSNINEMSPILTSLISNKVQFQSNLSPYHLQYLKQHDCIIDTNTYEVVPIDFKRNAIKTLVEFNANEIMMEYNGYVSLADEYNKEYDFKKIYNPFVLFYEKYDHLPLSIDSKFIENKARHIRRSCTPNAEVKHCLLQDGRLRFYIVPINRINKNSEITIAFDYNFMKCRYTVDCACTQLSCQLLYLRLENESKSHMAANNYDSYNTNLYECNNINHIDMENNRAPIATKRPYKKRGRGSKMLNTSGRPTSDSVAIDVPKESVKIVRSNKRGRPPLNRSVGIQRSDIIVTPHSDPGSDSNNNNNNNIMGQSKDESDNESVHSQAIESIYPLISIHANFKNFKRISANHWSLKANRKIAAIAKKSTPVKELLIPPKIGRPAKMKKSKPVENIGKSMKILFDERNSYMSDENDDSISLDSNKHDLSHDEEGKYWLEEINNKILKQKKQESKKVQRKNKISRKKMNVKSVDVVVSDEIVEPEEINEPVIPPPTIITVKEEVIEPEPIYIAPLTPADKKESSQTTRKLKRGRKCQKPNANYILSYKPSNIDDVNNDLMLISAGFDDDIEKESEEQMNNKEEFNFVEESVEPVEDLSFECVEQILEKSTSKGSESDISMTMNNSSEDRLNLSKNSVNSTDKSSDSIKDKAGREERWVNNIWQRIMKNGNPDETQYKQRNSHSSTAEDSVTSEENRKESTDIVSPMLKINKGLSEEKDTKINVGQIVKKLSIAESEPMNNQLELHSSLIERPNVFESMTFPKVNDEQEHKSSPVTNTKNRSLSQARIEEVVATATKPYINTNIDNLNEKISSIDNISKHSFLPPVFSSIDNTDLSNNPPKRRINHFSLEEPFKCHFQRTGKYECKSEPSAEQEQSKTKLTLSEYRKRRLNDKLVNDSSNILNKYQRSNDEECNDNVFVHGIIHKEPTIIETTKMDERVSMDNARRIRVSGSESVERVDNERKMEERVLMDNAMRIRVSGSESVERVDNERKMDEIVSMDNARRIRVSGSESVERVDNERKMDERVLMDNARRIRVSGSESVERGDNATKMDEIVLMNNARRIKVSSSESVERVDNETLATRPRTRTSISDLHSSMHSDLSIISYQQPVLPTIVQQDTPTSPNNDDGDDDIRSYNHGPRTPSDNGQHLHHNTGTSINQPSDTSVHSFESQPSPTSDCHFDFEKYSKTAVDNDESIMIVAVDWSNDWTNSTVSIAKMAGIKRPDLLEEIEEYEDEYVPLPDNLPERSKEEIETLLLTQKRDSQIREWQEVKQLQREKAKIDHQVRRLHRVNRRQSNDGRGNNVFATYDVRNDEQTMKTFNVQLAGINDRLMAEIESARQRQPQYTNHRRKESHCHDSGGGKKSRLDITLVAAPSIQTLTSSDTTTMRITSAVV